MRKLGALGGGSIFGRGVAVAIASALGLIGLAGCGGSSEAPPVTAPPQVAAQVEIPIVAATAEPEAEAPAPEDSDTGVVYKMKLAAEDRPTLLLTKVIVKSDSTRLRFSMFNESSPLYSIMVSKPGDPRAMFLQTANGAKVPVKRILGIAVKPDQTELKLGAKKTFTLVFDALPPGTRSFDIYEGDESKEVVRTEQTRNLWVWRNVELK